MNVNYLNSFTNYPLILRKNNNIVSHLIKVLVEITLSKTNMDNRKNRTIEYKSGDTENTEFINSLKLRCFTRQKTNTTEIMLFGSEIINHIQSRINIHKPFFKIYNYILNNQYFNDLELGIEKYTTNLNNQLIILKDKDYQNHFLVNGKKDINMKVNKVLNVENLYSIYYDIFEKNNTKYVFSIELIEIWYSNYNDTAKSIINNFKSMDILLYIFINNKPNENMRELLIELLGGKEEYDKIIDNDIINSAIHGIYKVKVEVLDNKYKKALNRVGRISNNIEKMNEDNSYDIELSFKQTEKFYNNHRHTYLFSINPIHFNKPRQKLNDLQLIKLFKKEKVKIKNKRKLITDINFTDEDNYESEEEYNNETNDSSSNEETETFYNNRINKLSIRFTDNVFNRENITELLYELIHSNIKFEYEYYKYGYINCYKDYDKTYTSQKYINFSFEDLTRKKQSITYHAYLNTSKTKVIRASVKI
jgi:hypothetical protein